MIKQKNRKFVYCQNNYIQRVITSSENDKYFLLNMKFFYLETKEQPLICSGL